MMTYKVFLKEKILKMYNGKTISREKYLAMWNNPKVQYEYLSLNKGTLVSMINSEQVKKIKQAKAKGTPEKDLL